MFCPKCSTKASTEQKFCRSCGMELQPVADLVRNDNSGQKPEHKAEPAFDKRRRAMLIWGCIILFGSVAVGASLKILAKEGIRPAGDFTPYLSVLALLMVFFAMGMMCLATLGSISPRRRLREDSSGVDQGGNSQARRLSDQPSSITELTTEFLEDNAATVRARDTAPHRE